VIFSAWSKVSSIPITRTAPMYRSMNGKAGLVMTVAMSVIMEIVITAPHVTMIFVNPAQAIAGCVMRRFVWAVQVNVTAVKN
jgi:hypothetical protein